MESWGIASRLIHCLQGPGPGPRSGMESSGIVSRLIHCQQGPRPGTRSGMESFVTLYHLIHWRQGPGPRNPRRSRPQSRSRTRSQTRSRSRSRRQAHPASGGPSHLLSYELGQPLQSPCPCFRQIFYNGQCLCHYQVAHDGAGKKGSGSGAL